MNLFGSYLALRNNSMAAILAAIEIYNKPQIAYRDECFTILLVNAWELLLKAILSKRRTRIYYPKQRGQPYRTLTIQDSLTAARSFFPSHVEYDPVYHNIRMLVEYRNQAIHYHNERGMSIIIYGLAQTSVTNYRDLMLTWFGLDIADKMTIVLLPLALGPLPDPVEYLRNTNAKPPRNREVVRYMRMISDTTQSLESQNCDTGRFLTVFKVSLQSVKKVTAADIVVGISAIDSLTDGKVLSPVRSIDPNITHPLRQKDILIKIGDTLQGMKFTKNTFQAVISYLDIRNKAHLYWRSNNGEVTKYSNEVVAQIRQLSRSQLQEAVEAYRHNQKQQRGNKTPGWQPKK